MGFYSSLLKSATSTHLATQAGASRSSNWSKIDLVASSAENFTCGSTDQAWIIFFDRPLPINNLPKLFFSIFSFNQFDLSASPSKGDAEAWTPLSPTSGLASRPRASQSEKIFPLKESAGASAGSVGPNNFPLKSSHESSEGSNSTAYQWIERPGLVNLLLIDMKNPLNT